MNKNMNNSSSSRLPKLFTIKFRLTVWYILILALVLVCFSLVLYWDMERSMYHEAGLLLDTQARQLLSGLEAEEDRVYLPEIQDLTASGTLAAFYDVNGSLLDGSPKDNIIPTQITPTQQSSLARNQGSDWNVLTVPVTQNGKTLGWLRLARSLDTEEHALQRLLAILLFIVPFTLLVASGGGYFLAWKALAPIDRITRTAQDIGRGDISQRLGWRKTNDEIGRLASTFDEMLNRLEQSFKRQQQFTADASHELRTPIAVIRAQAEQALSKEHSAGEYLHALEIINQQSERMGDLVGQLLFLARSDAGEEALQKETFDLQQLVEISVEEMKEKADSKGIELQYENHGNSLSFYGDQSRLIQLLSNLLDNAIKYTLPGGKVTVSAMQNKGNILLLVRDTGIGIPVEQQLHIFERFYRVDRSRSRIDGSTGLGLAICRQIAEAHGGCISVDSKPGNGSTFIVNFPVNTSSD